MCIMMVLFCYRPETSVTALKLFTVASCLGWQGWIETLGHFCFVLFVFLFFSFVFQLLKLNCMLQNGAKVYLCFVLPAKVHLIPFLSLAGVLLCV